MRVLVVDDKPDIAEMVSHALTMHGMSVVTVHTGTDAMCEFWKAMGEGNPFGIFVLDCALPGLDGWSVAANIRRAEGQMPHLIKATLVGYTGYGAEAEALVTEKDFSLFDRVFTKPADPIEFIGFLTQSARGRESAEEK